MSNLHADTSSTTAEVIRWLSTEEGRSWSSRHFARPHNQQGRIAGTRMFSLEPIVYPTLKGAYVHRGGDTRLDPDSCDKQLTWEEYADWWVRKGSKNT